MFGTGQCSPPFHGSRAPKTSARNHQIDHPRQSFATLENLRGGGVSMSGGGGKGEEETLVQYVVLRRDLVKSAICLIRSERCLALT